MLFVSIHFVFYLKRTGPIIIKIFHLGICPQPHLASMVAVQKQLSRSKKDKGLGVDMGKGVGALSQHLYPCLAYDSLVSHTSPAQ